MGDNNVVKRELDRLTNEFFRAVSFETSGSSAYEVVHSLFVESGLLIKNSGSVPEISTVQQFIAPHQTMVLSGDLTQFNEHEISEATAIFGNIAHRFSVHAKSGTMKNVEFAAKGMISTQFILTPSAWKMSAMAWDDERPGLSVAAS